MKFSSSQNEPMYTTHKLQEYYQAHFSSHLDLHLKIEAFFHTPDVYGRHPNSIFYIGTHPKLHSRDVLIPLSVLKREMLPQMKLFMNIISQPLQLPMEPTQYINLEPISFETKDAYEQCWMKIVQFNMNTDKKRQSLILAASNNPLIELRRQFTGKVFVAVNTQTWEKNANTIIELGWAVWRGAEPEIELRPPPLQGGPCKGQRESREKRDVHIVARHYVIGEHYHTCNGAIIADEKFEFLFGDSKVAGIQEVIKSFIGEMAGLSKTNEVILVGNGVASVMSQLSKMGVNLPPHLQTIEIATLNEAYTGQPGTVNVDLEKLVQQFKFNGHSYNNAGNGAYYTMLVFREYTRIPLNTLTVLDHQE